MGFRVDVRAGLHARLVAFNAAQSGLHQIYRNRPASFGSTPLAYVGGISEEISHDSGTRQRRVQAAVVLIDTLQDNEETADRLDALADALLDDLTANPHAIGGNTVQAPVRSDSTELTADGAIYAAITYTIQGLILEGRM